MRVVIELSNRVGPGVARLAGPFRAVELAHRRVFGDSRSVAIGHADGSWRPAGADERFLVADIRPSDTGVLRLTFAGQRAGGERVRETTLMRVTGDGLWLAGDADRSAFDSDDARAWITTPDGDMFDRLIAA